jgi:hypothetical protein
MVDEMVPAHVSKRGAIEALMNLPQLPVHGSPDVATFRAAVRLGGLALTVAGEAFPKENADFAQPSEVRAWLAAFASA